MPGASGAQLLSMLTAAAGQRLDRDAALDLVAHVAAAGVLTGYEDAVNVMVQARDRHPPRRPDVALASRITAPLQDAMRAAVGTQSPAFTALREAMQAALAAQFEPLRDAARRTAELHGQVAAATASHPSGVIRKYLVGEIGLDGDEALKLLRR